MSKPTTRVKAAAVYACQNKEQVVEAIGEIGKLQRQRDRIAAEMNDKIAAIKQKYEEQAAPHAARITELASGVQSWCESRREELTQCGKVKTVALPTGEVCWRLSTPKVMVRSEELVMETLRKMGLDRFIRTKPEINKQAILAEPAEVSGVKGITISQSESFVVKPFETALEEVA